MKRFFIAGAGGFGREVYWWLVDYIKAQYPDFNNFIETVGFIDDNKDALQNFKNFPSVVSSIKDYLPGTNDCIVLGVGKPAVRRKIVEILREKHACFFTLIHPKAHIFETSSIGEGSVIGPWSIVSDHVRIGKFTLVQPFATLGHDSVLGDFSELCPKVSVSGNCTIGDMVFLGSNSVVAPGITIAEQTQVLASTCVMKNVFANSFVAGVPGKEIKNFFESYK